MIEICFAVSAGILGIFTGAQITEGILIVPYWKSLEPKAFYQFFKKYGPMIYQFYAVLTVAATIIPVGTAIYSLTIKSQSHFFPILMGVFTVLFFLTYSAYFKKANKRFEDAALTDEELPKELHKWGKWHWGRIYLEMGALLCALVALLGY